jgi:DME family drug/metabolite transporter
VRIAGRLPQPTPLDRWRIFGAAFLFSTGGAAIKACSLGSWQVAGLRSGVAAVSLLVLLPDARRGWTWRTALAGIAYAATLILFVLANKLTTSANAIFLQSTAPLYLLLLGPLVLREPVQKIDVIVVSSVAAGALLLLFGSESAATAPDPARGNVFALFSAVAYALMITGMRWLGRREGGQSSATATVVVGNIIAFAACLPMALPIPHVGLADAAVLLYLGVFQIGLAYMCLALSISRVPALEASTLLLIEPVFNPIWTWLFHGERPNGLAMLGGLAIVTATFTGAWWRSRAERG